MGIKQVMMCNMSAETLQRFTPVVYGTTTAGVGTYTEATGRIAQAGSIVTVQIILSITDHTGTGNIKISGIPAGYFPATPALAPLWGISLAYTAGETPYVIFEVDGTITLLTGSAGAWHPIAIDTSFTAYITGTYILP